MMKTPFKRQRYTRGFNLSNRPIIRGVAAIEFAFVLIPLILMVFGVAEFGRALYQYNTLTKAVRDSARMLSQYNPADADYPLADAKCLAVYGVTCGKSTVPLATGLTTSMVTVCNPINSSGCPGNNYASVPTGGGSINLVEVRISGYKFNSVVPLVTGAASIAFSNIQVTMRQVL